MAHPSVNKAPALAKRLIKELEDLGYEYDEAVAMLDEEGTRSIREFIDAEKAEATGYARKPELDTPESTCYVKTDNQGNTTNIKQITKETDMLKITVDGKGKTTNVETVDTGNGIQAAKPLPKVEPTKVEPTPTAELMYTTKNLSAEVVAEIDSILTHKYTLNVPVLHVVGINEGRPIYKVSKGQTTVDAWAYLYRTHNPKVNSWLCNMPAIVVAPTDEQLLKQYNITTAPVAHDKAQANFYLVCASAIETLKHWQDKQVEVVVAPPASTKEQSAKVKAKASKPEQAPLPTPEKKTPAITEAALGELATATNHMKKVSLVNQILVALGEPKVSSKCKKDELTPVISRLLAQFNVPVTEQAPTTTTKTTEAKATKEPQAPAPTKADLEKWYVSSGKGTKKEFAALDYNWRSSTERARAAADLGFTA